MTSGPRRTPQVAQPDRAHAGGGPRIRPEEIPRPRELGVTQVRGFSCVWCNTRLEDATAVDLPRQRLRIVDRTTHWYPRACPACAGSGAP
jgi:hypothetical protein